MSRLRLERGLKVTLIGLVTNAVLAFTKVLAGWIGHSHALIADGVESMADIISSLLVWRGLVVAEAPADDEHPYGHGKAEPIAALGVSLLLLMAAMWIAIEGVREILTPHSLPAPFTLVVLVTVIVIKEGLYRFAVKEAAAIESSAITSDAWHHRSDAITSICAGLGITISLLGGPGYEAADDVAAVMAAGVICWNGVRLIKQALAELMDRSAEPELIARITLLASDVPGVLLVEKCLVRKAGWRHFVDMHIEVDPELSVRLAHEIAHAVKDRVRSAEPSVHDVMVHVEPGLPKLMNVRQ